MAGEVTFDKFFEMYHNLLKALINNPELSITISVLAYLYFDTETEKEKEALFKMIEDLINKYLNPEFSLMYQGDNKEILWKVVKLFIIETILYSGFVIGLSFILSGEDESTKEQIKTEAIKMYKELMK